MPCQIKGCSRKARTRGLCSKHYAEYWFKRNMEAINPKPQIWTWEQLRLPGII